MLDIQELDDIIYQRLGRHDMAQCARVCKKWHFVAISYLWRDLTWLEDSYKQRLSFCKVVHDDYLREQRRRKMQDEEHAMEQPIQDHPSPLSPLSKYGSQIQTLPGPLTLRHAFASHKPLLHLYSLCPSEVQVEVLRIRLRDMNFVAGNPWTSIMNFTLSRLRQLNINLSLGPLCPGISDLMSLLGQCSTILESLKLNVEIYYDQIEYDDSMEEQIEDGASRWTSLKELNLHECADKTDAKRFWSWLFRRCNSVERLTVNKCVGIFQSLEQGMQTHMPNLQELNLGCQQGRAVGMTGDVTAALLSSPRNGWKALRFGQETVFGKAAMDALANFSSLEIFETDGCTTFSANSVLYVLRSCTNLHTVTITNPGSFHWNSWSRINGKVFIDQDPDTGLLTPWKCERSLKVLKVTINGIPRPDLDEYSAIAEAYPGQGREIEGLVYDRLARLTNLETLWLGDSSYTHQAQSLEMSLESGLGKLSELRSLRELSTMGYKLRLHVKEAQWMAEHWPRLHRLRSYWYTKEVLEWIQEHHPEIELMKG